MIPTRIGQDITGGTFTGFNRVRDRVYAIVASPASAETQRMLKTSLNVTIGTSSICDGYSNTTAMAGYEHPAAQYCRDLKVNGCNDWYLPSANELELIYRYLKPTRNRNRLNRLPGPVWAYKRLVKTNATSIPTLSKYTNTTPSQTIVIAHINNDADTSEDTDTNWHYWTSTEYLSNHDDSTSVFQRFDQGTQSSTDRTDCNVVRPVRRELIVQIED